MDGIPGVINAAADGNFPPGAAGPSARALPVGKYSSVLEDMCNRRSMALDNSGSARASVGDSANSFDFGMAGSGVYSSQSGQLSSGTGVQPPPQDSRGRTPEGESSPDARPEGSGSAPAASSETPTVAAGSAQPSESPHIKPSGAGQRAVPYMTDLSVLVSSPEDTHSGPSAASSTGAGDGGYSSVSAGRSSDTGHHKVQDCGPTEKAKGAAPQESPVLFSGVKLTGDPSEDFAGLERGPMEQSTPPPAMVWALPARTKSNQSEDRYASHCDSDPPGSTAEHARVAHNGNNNPAFQPLSQPSTTASSGIRIGGPESAPSSQGYAAGRGRVQRTATTSSLPQAGLDTSSKPRAAVKDPEAGVDGKRQLKGSYMAAAVNATERSEQEKRERERLAREMAKRRAEVAAREAREARNKARAASERRAGGGKARQGGALQAGKKYAEALRAQARAKESPPKPAAAAQASPPGIMPPYPGMYPFPSAPAPYMPPFAFPGGLMPGSAPGYAPPQQASSAAPPLQLRQPSATAAVESAAFARGLAQRQASNKERQAEDEVVKKLEMSLEMSDCDEDDDMPELPEDWESQLNTTVKHNGPSGRPHSRNSRAEGSNFAKSPLAAALLELVGLPGMHARMDPVTQAVAQRILHGHQQETIKTGLSMEEEALFKSLRRIDPQTLRKSMKVTAPARRQPVLHSLSPGPLPTPRPIPLTLAQAPGLSPTPFVAFSRFLALGLDARCCDIT